MTFYRVLGLQFCSLLVVVVVVVVVVFLWLFLFQSSNLLLVVGGQPLDIITEW